MAPADTQPLSVVVVRPTLGPGGADRVTITLLRSFDRARVKPSLALFRREGQHLGDVPEDVPLETLGASSLWTAWWPLARYLRRASPDVVLSTCSGTNVVACIASLLSSPFSGRRARLVLSERNVLFRDQPFAKKWLMFLAKRVLYRRADAVTAVSQGVGKELVEKLAVPPERLCVVYNPIVGPEIDDLAAEELDDAPYDDADPIVLAAGRLVPAKGFDVLLRAFAEVSRQRAVRLVIVGEGPLRGALLRQAAELGIEDRLHLPGFVKNPFRYMAQSTAFVLSSRYEGLPGVLIQAMACGLPVVATDCNAGPNEIITPGRDGLLVPVDSAPAIAAEISRILDDPAFAARLGKAARERVQSFEIDVVAERYLRVLTGDETASADDIPCTPVPVGGRARPSGSPPRSEVG